MVWSIFAQNVDVMSKKKEITIRSGAAEYLSYIASVGDQPISVELRYEDENIWLTQRLMAELYGVEVSTVNEHIAKVFSDGELQEDATIRKFRIVQQEGNRMVNRDTIHYNLQMIIAVGFKVNNERAVQFRKWANGIVKEYTIKGWVMDDVRLKEGGFLTDKYFDAQLERIREIRLNGFLTLMDREVLADAGKVSAEMAKIHAETEWEKYRIVQDRLYQSDFDRFLLLEEESATITKQSKS